MILNVDFAFTARVRIGRKRNPDDVLYLATQPVEVREVAAAEAPVAIVTHEKESSDDPQVKRYRLLDGELWIPSRTGRKGPADAGWLAAAATSVDSDPHGSSHPFAATVSARHTLRGRFEEDAERAVLYGSDREERAAAVREAAACYILVDGIVHARAPEPCYEVSQSSTASFLYIKPFDPPRPRGETDVRYGVHLFRADEAEAMRAEHDDLYDYPNGDAPRIEVLIPDAVRAPLAESGLRAGAHYLVEDLGKLALARDVEFFKLYAEARDAAARLSEALARHPKGHPDVAEAAGAAIPAVEAGIKALVEGDPHKRRSVGVEWSTAGIRRVEARQIQDIPTP